MTTELQKDYFLRVGAGSELAGSMNLLADGKWHTEEELIQASGKKRGGWTLRMYDKIFDNITVRYNGKKQAYKLDYVDVVGNQSTVVNVQQADFAGSGNGAGGSQSSDIEQMRWPTAPPILKKKDFFRKPSWFEGMRAMVKLGRHISLASPPGVGKDTAVEQLAAEHGVPLVSEGGDAGLRKKDLVGTQEMVNGTTVFNVAEFAAAAVNGWWASVTEVNAADPDVLLLINKIVETPNIINIHGKMYPVHPNFRLFITYNPGLVGTKPLPQSFKDRFYSIKLSFLGMNELHQRLIAHGMPEETLLVNGDPISKQGWTDQVVKYGMAMWEAHESGRMRYQITVRRLNDAVALMNMETTGGNVKKALRMAVVGAIDSPVEAKVAEKILGEVCS